MIKGKYIFLLAVILISFIACGDDEDTNGIDPNFDHTAQALKDNDSIIKFLKSYYFDDTIDSLKPIVAGKTALFDDARLKSQSVTEDINDVDVDFTLYYFEQNAGNPTVDKGFPTKMDSILVKYDGRVISKPDSISSTFEIRNVNPVWQNLYLTIKGWQYGFQNFKGGDNATNNGPITFSNSGEGILIIPSGLAYRNVGSGVSIPANANLIFYFDLYDFVKDTDHDNDGLASILEDPDGDGDPTNDDSDEDFISNFIDVDDDNDGTLTIDEDVNGDGDPRNDDTDGDGIPNYLDPDDN